MAFNLGFQTKCILSPWCMLFHHPKVLLKVFSILFKVHWTCCAYAWSLLYTVILASDPDSEWLLHVMTPHFPTKKASETGLLLLPLSSPTALWADHNIPLNLCQTNWTFSLLTVVKKILSGEKPTGLLKACQHCSAICHEEVEEASES